MEDNKIPYIVFEGEQARNERHFKRLWIVIILLIVLLVGSNGLWIWYEAQWTNTVVTQDVDTSEGNAVVNGVGDMYYGENQANSQD